MTPIIDGNGYDPIAEFYLGFLGDGSERDVVLDEVVRLAGDVRGRAVIDLACGEGRVARALVERGANVTGVDISARLVEMGMAREQREPLGVSFIVGDVTTTEWWDSRPVDVVVCNHGLADIGDLDGALRTAASVLRPDGVFVFSILHPCCPGNGPTTPSAWPPDGGYGVEGWWLADNPGMRGKVGSNFRRLSTYLNSLIEHGFTITTLTEPASAKVPMFLAVACQKATST